MTQTTPNLNDYKFVPVLLWKPHPSSNKSCKVKGSGLREDEERREEEEEKPLLKKMDLSDSLPPTVSNTTCTASSLSQSKQRRIIEVRERGREGGRERGREREREGGRERGSYNVHVHVHVCGRGREGGRGEGQY